MSLPPQKKSLHIKLNILEIGGWWPRPRSPGVSPKNLERASGGRLGRQLMSTIRKRSPARVADSSKLIFALLHISENRVNLQVGSLGSQGTTAVFFATTVRTVCQEMQSDIQIRTKMSARYELHARMPEIALFGRLNLGRRAGAVPAGGRNNQV